MSQKNKRELRYIVFLLPILICLIFLLTNLSITSGSEGSVYTLSWSRSLQSVNNLLPATFFTTLLLDLFELVFSVEATGLYFFMINVISYWLFIEMFFVIFDLFSWLLSFADMDTWRN